MKQIRSIDWLIFSRNKHFDWWTVARARELRRIRHENITVNVSTGYRGVTLGIHVLNAKRSSDGRHNVSRLENENGKQ